MNIQKPKNTRAGAKRKPTVAARRPSKVAKEVRSQREKHPSARNAVKPLIPSLADQNPCAHWRSPMDMIFQGRSTRVFQA